MRSHRRLVVTLLLVAAMPLAALGPVSTPAGGLPWWVWALLLFAVSIGIGIAAVLGGIGGGVVFVPLVGGLFPFHLDFVRAAGLIVALAGSLTATPFQLRRSYAYLKLMLPAGLVSSVGAIAGARVGLELPGRLVQLLLGFCVLGIALLMFLARTAEYPRVDTPDTLSTALDIGGVYHEASTGQTVRWQVRNTPFALVLTLGVGFLAGMFGLGAGWANVPVFNLLMGAPLRVAAATSTFLISVSNTTAAWIYLSSGAVLPLIVVPSVLGMMAGSRIGVSLSAMAKPRVVRYAVVALLAFSGARALLKGFGI